MWLFFGCLELGEALTLILENASAEEENEQDLDQEALSQQPSKSETRTRTSLSAPLNQGISRHQMVRQTKLERSFRRISGKLIKQTHPVSLVGEKSSVEVGVSIGGPDTN